MNWSPPYIYMGLYEEESDTLDIINPAREGDILIRRLPEGEKLILKGGYVEVAGSASYGYRADSEVVIMGNVVERVPASDDADCPAAPDGGRE